MSKSNLTQYLSEVQHTKLHHSSYNYKPIELATYSYRVQLITD